MIMDVVYAPHYTVIAAIVLLIVPVVFHLVAFRKSRRFLHVLTSILVGNFILAFVEEVAGMTCVFDARIILLFSLLIAGVVGYLISKKNTFDENLLSSKVSTGTILFVLGIAIFVFLYQKNTFPPFSDDTLSTYLPWARTIVNEHVIPAFHFGSNYRYVIHYPPFLYTNIAFLFSFFGEYYDSITAAIPILYTCFFILLIVNWSKEYSDGTVPFFVLLSLLSSLLFVHVNFLLLQEPILLFFVTSSFYFLFKYIKTKETTFLALLSVSSALSSLTKYSGVVIAVILFCVLIITWIKDKKEISKILMVFPVTHIPAILWAIRNIYFFNNPVYPYLGGIFESSIIGYGSILPGLVSCDPPATLQGVVIRVLIGFPAIVFSLIYMIKRWKEIEVRYTIIIYAVFMFFVYYTGAWLIRYFLYPVLGIFAFFAGIEISKLYNKIHIKILKEKNVIKTVTVIFLCIILIIAPAPISFISDLKTSNYKSLIGRLDPTKLYLNSVYENESGVLEYLQNEGEKDIIILGDFNYKCNWYGENYTSLEPWSRSFTILNSEEPFNFTKNSTYIYINLKKLGIDYIYDSPVREYGLEKLLFGKVNQDPEHFEPVYNKNSYRLWKIK